MRNALYERCPGFYDRETQLGQEADAAAVGRLPAPSVPGSGFVTAGAQAEAKAERRLRAHRCWPFTRD